MQNKYSNCKIAWFNYKLNALHDEIVTAPICIRLKPTNKCNHNCRFCVYKPDVSKMHDTANRTDTIPVGKLMEIVNDMARMGVKAVTLSGGGEPLFHPAAAALLEFILDAGLKLSIITNGQNMNGEIAWRLCRAKWIRVSMDYCTADMMAKSRGLSPFHFEEMENNVRWMAEHKSPGTDLTANYIITKENCESLYDAADMMQDWGFDIIRFSPVWMPNFVEYHDPIKDEVLKQLARIRDTFKDVAIYHSYNITNDQFRHAYQRCYFSEIVPVIAADQNVYACHNKAYDPTGLLGSIKEQSFRQMWLSEQTRNRLREIVPMRDCNHQCANDAKNKFIQDIMLGYGDTFV